jgi:hypothetical protein
MDTRRGARAETGKALDELRAKRGQLARQLDELKQSPQELRRDVQAGLESAVAELERAYENVKARFKE